MTTPKRRRKPAPRRKKPSRKRAKPHASTSATSGNKVQAAPEDVATPTQKSVLTFDLDGLTYILDRLPPKAGGRKPVITVKLSALKTDPGLVDRCDIYSFPSRERFAGLIADKFGREQPKVMGHLTLIVDSIERQALKENKPTAPVLTPERMRDAEKILQAHDVLDRFAAAMNALGFVGETRASRVCILVATSRLLRRPLNLLLLAPAGTGKSAALDAISTLMPPEAVVSVARITQHSLFWLEEDVLKHRLLLVDEYEGQAEADHAIRVLQSRGELRQSVPVKGTTEERVVRGPVATMSGTTLTNIDVQNTSRCIELTLDDSEKQTKLVQLAQARAWAGLPNGPRGDLEAFRDAQRLLAESVPVEPIIPFAPKLKFPSRTTADRRVSEKLLGLVAAHALLFSRQRERKGGKIVATASDYAAVYELVSADLVTPEGLSTRAVSAYRVIKESDHPTDRRDIATALGWSYNTAKKAVRELEEQELVKVAEAGPPAKYRVVGSSILGGTAELTHPSEIE